MLVLGRVAHVVLDYSGVCSRLQLVHLRVWVVPEPAGAAQTPCDVVCLVLESQCRVSELFDAAAGGLAGAVAGAGSVEERGDVGGALL